jgi:hypothetical protein
MEALWKPLVRTDWQVGLARDAGRLIEPRAFPGCLLLVRRVSIVVTCLLLE